MNTESASVLVVDDENESRQQLVQLLRAEGYRTSTATNGKKALAAISSNSPDLILLDVTMPGMDGFEVASKLKATPATANIPIIMVTAHIGRGARVVALDSGAEEYLTKPVDPAELSLRVRNLLRLSVRSEPTPSDGAMGETPSSNAEAGHLAYYDAVTGLPNAAQFREAARKTLAEAAGSGAVLIMMSIDVDDFARINKTQGIEFGDELLRHMGSLLVDRAGSRDAVGRMNEDKFALLLPMPDTRISATVSADDVRHLLRTPIAINDKEACATVSIGVALYPQDGADAETLLSLADAARGVAKRAGGDASHVHSRA